MQLTVPSSVRSAMSRIVVLAVTLTGVVALTAAPAAQAVAAPAGGTYHAVSPARILDTGAGTGAPKVPVAAHGTLTVAVAGAGGVPASGVSAVVLNVTAAAPAASGYLTVFPSTDARPTASNLNFVAGKSVPNLVVVKLGTSGAVSLYNGSAGAVRLIADVSGYFASGAPAGPGDFQPLSPTRILDTRIGLGATAASAAARHTVAVQVAGQGGVPASGVSAVVINVTVAKPGAGGYATVFPSGTSRPTTSNLNFVKGVTAPNLVFAALGSDGKIDLYNGSDAAVSFIGDVAGYYLGGSPTDVGAYHPVSPVRVWDTRDGTNTDGTPIPAHGTITVDLGGAGGAPAFGGMALALNVTVTRPGASGYLTVFPQGSSRPITSNLNFGKGQSVPNLVVAQPDTDGRISLYNGSAGPVDVIGDLAGYFIDRPLIHFGTGAYSLVTSINWPQALSCVSSTFCLGVGPTGLVERFNGTSWSAPQPVEDSGVAALSCVTTTFCLAVGQDGSAERYNGSTWTDAGTSSGNSQGWVGLSCASSTFCMLLDRGGKAYKFNGTSWTGMTLGVDPLVSVSCTSSTFCIAVEVNDTTDAAHSLRYNGSTWSAPVSVSADGSYGATCLSTSFCASLSYDGSLAVYGGTGWTSKGDTGLFNGLELTCATSTYCQATGDSASGPSFEEWDGTSWTDPVSLGDDSLILDDCVSPTSCVGLTFAGYGRTFNGSVWSDPVPVDPSSGNMASISCAAASACMAVTDAGFAVRYTGSWGTPIPVTDRTPLAGVSCPAATSCQAVGSDLATTYNGTSWSTPAVIDNGANLLAVACPTTAMCLAVDDQGQGLRLDGATWSAPVPVDAGHPLSSVSCASATDCVAVSGDGDAIAYNGTTWGAPQALGANEGLTSVSCGSDGSCAVVGNNGTVVLGDGTSWDAPTDLSPGFELDAVSCLAGSFCVAVGQNSLAYTFDGTSWASADTDPFSELNGISCVSTQLCHGISDNWALDGTSD